MRATKSLTILLLLFCGEAYALTPQEYSRLPVYSRVLYSLMHSLAPPEGMYAETVSFEKFDIPGMHSQTSMSDKPKNWFLVVTKNPQLGLVVATNRSSGEIVSGLRSGSVSNCLMMSAETRADHVAGLAQLGPMEMHEALLRQKASEEKKPIPEVASELFEAIKAHKGFVKMAGTTIPYFMCLP